MRDSTLKDLEPLLEDWRVERAAMQVIDRLGVAETDGWDFVTFVVPKREIPRSTPEGIAFLQTIDAKAVYAIVSPNPRPYAKKRGHQIMTHATMDLREFLNRDSLDGVQDAAIFLRIAQEHAKTIGNLRDLIN